MIFNLALCFFPAAIIHRSNLPDNLKKLFRSLAMTRPDNQIIAQVMLFSQGFRSAEKLASKIVPFFKLCDEQLSSQRLVPLTKIIHDKLI